MTSQQKTWLIVLTVIFSSGVTPIAIRYTQAAGMPSLVIVFIRLWLISLALLPVVWMRYRNQLLDLTQQQILLGMIAGFWLAINLFMLFLALEYTSVLVTSVLRRTTPLWIIAPEVLLLGAVFSRRTILSIVLTFTGVLMITGGGGAVEMGEAPLLGAGMATFGAICFGIYLLIGRRLNNRMPSLLYSWLVFTSAAVVTTMFIVVMKMPVTGYPAAGYLWTLLVTFLAQVLGQLVINIGLQHFSATAMAIILQVGVVVSAIIAAFLFGEVPSMLQAIGSVMVIIGVILVTIEKSQRVEA